MLGCSVDPSSRDLLDRLKLLDVALRELNVCIDLDFVIDLYNFYAELEKGSAKKSAAAKNDEDVEECLFFIGMKNAVPDVVATLVGLDAYSVEMRENAAATADPDAVGDVDDVVVGCAAPTGFVYIETLRIASTGVTLFFDATPESSSGSGP